MTIAMTTPAWRRAGAGAWQDGASCKHIHAHTCGGEHGLHPPPHQACTTPRQACAHHHGTAYTCPPPGGGAHGPSVRPFGPHHTSLHPPTIRRSDPPRAVRPAGAHAGTSGGAGRGTTTTGRPSGRGAGPERAERRRAGPSGRAATGRRSVRPSDTNPAGRSDPSGRGAHRAGAGRGAHHGPAGRSGRSGGGASGRRAVRAGPSVGPRCPTTGRAASGRSVRPLGPSVRPSGPAGRSVRPRAGRGRAGPLAVKKKTKEMKSSATLDAAADRGGGGARSARDPRENWSVFSVSHVRNYYRRYDENYQK
jgi:hypothetical protein